MRGMPFPLPSLLVQAIAPAHVGMDAFLQLPIIIVAVGGIAFIIRIEMRQRELEKEQVRMDKRQDKLEADLDVQDTRLHGVEQEQAVQAVTLGRIEGGVERIERRLDKLIGTGRANTPPPERSSG
jgi:hypothetical protein